MFLVRSGFGIADDDAVGSSRSHVVLLWEVNGFRVGFEFIGVRLGSFEDSHFRGSRESSDSMQGRRGSLLAIVSRMCSLDHGKRGRRSMKDDVVFINRR